MSRLALLIIIHLIYFSSAKLILNVQDIDLDGVPEARPLVSPPTAEKLWILDINEDVLFDLKLRRATAVEEEEFVQFSEPLIEKYQNMKTKMVKKDVQNATSNASETEHITTEDIYKYLNKFQLFSKTEPSAYLEEDKQTITVNFKGQYTSLLVKIGQNEWHYFYSNPPLPSWFYEEHNVADQDDFVPVPEEVKEKFYSALYHLLENAIKYLV